MTCTTCDAKDKELLDYYGEGPYTRLDSKERPMFHAQHTFITLSCSECGAYFMGTMPEYGEPFCNPCKNKEPKSWIERAEANTLPVQDSTGGGHFAYKPTHS